MIIINDKLSCVIYDEEKGKGEMEVRWRKEKGVIIKTRG
jgi:hypothetical protein